MSKISMACHNMSCLRCGKSAETRIVFVEKIKMVEDVLRQKWTTLMLQESVKNKKLFYFNALPFEIGAGKRNVY